MVTACHVALAVVMGGLAGSVVSTTMWNASREKKPLPLRKCQELVHQGKGTCQEIQQQQCKVIHAEAPRKGTPGHGGRLHCQSDWNSQGLPNMTSKEGSSTENMSFSNT